MERQRERGERTNIENLVWFNSSLILTTYIIGTLHASPIGLKFFKNLVHVYTLVYNLGQFDMKFILFSALLKFSKILSSKSKKYCEGQ
jgi:hypothetical protein